MGKMPLGEFADTVNELMPVISKQFLKYQTSDFYKMKMTMPQFILLDVLARHSESKMSDLAHYMNVTTAAITGVADRLVRDGYIVRVSDPKDRRIVKVKLTAKGISVVQRCNDQKKKMVMDVFGVISQEERDEYLKILMHIRDHIAEKEH